jgi:hypothetical protein
VYLQPVDGGASDRIPTNRDFDLQYLPVVFLNSTRKPGKHSCEIANGARTIRHVDIYINDRQYLYVPIPWRGGTEEFKLFFNHLAENPKIVLATAIGEIISGFYTALYATGKPPTAAEPGF